MEKTAEKLKVNESLLKTVLCSATFWGLLAHGMVLFNKYSFHDDVRYFNEVGATYESGRWMLGILGSLSANLLGSKKLQPASGKWYDYDFVHCSNRISAGG